MKALCLAAVLCGLGAVLQAQPTYFVVGPQDGRPEGNVTNAFIIPLTDPLDVADARYHSATVDDITMLGNFPVHRGDFRPLVRIALGSDGTNRNVLLPDEPLWSWHVQEVVGWTYEFLPEWPYQDPWQLERDVLAGVVTNGFVVGFSGAYRVIAEISGELTLSVLPIPRDPLGQLADYFYWTRGGLEDWSQPPATRIFALEWTPNLNPPSWQTLQQAPVGYETNGVSRIRSRIFWVNREYYPEGFFRLRQRP